MRPASRKFGGVILPPFLEQEGIMESAIASAHHEPWNKGKLVGQKAPFKLPEIWAIRVRLQLQGRCAS